MVNRIDMSQSEPPEPTIREEILEVAGDDRILFMEGFDDCLVGVCEVIGQPPRAAYSVPKILCALQERSGMSQQEALEYFDFNIRGNYVGPYTPVLILPVDPITTE